MTQKEQADPDAFELVIVGAGMEALHLASRLPEQLLRKTAEVDASGAWLHSWGERWRRLGARHVRTPLTQHPHANALALQSYVEKQGKQQELLPTVKSFAPVPTFQLLEDFCRAKVVRQLPPGAQAVLADVVVAVEPHASGCLVRLASGRSLTARAVVYTPSNCTPVLPPWARGLLNSALETPATPGSDASCGMGSNSSGGGNSVGGSGGSSSSTLGLLVHGQVDLRGAELAGRQVAVVGGGMTAALLALGAVQRGAERVTLICRRPLRQQPFETEVGWWGVKQLGAYRQMGDPVLRHTACRRARGQASLNLPTWRQLAAAAAGGRLTVLEGWEVAEAAAEATAAAAAAEGTQAGAVAAGEGEPVPLVQPGGEGGSDSSSGKEEQGGPSSVWRLQLRRWCNEAGRPSVAAAAAPTAFQQTVAATAAAAAAAAASNGGGSAAVAAAPGREPTEGENQPQAQPSHEGDREHEAEQGCVLEADAVWVACGSAYNAAADPVLARLLQTAQQQEQQQGQEPHKAEQVGSLLPSLLQQPQAQQAAQQPAQHAQRGVLVGGYPWLLDEEHLCWPGLPFYLAGRSAMLAVGPCAGGLPGMRLAADRITKSLKRLDFAEEHAWVAAARRLSGLLLSSGGDGSSGGGAGAGSIGAGAAAAAADAAPLEAEGLAYEERKPKPSVSRPDHLVDMTDLDPALPRRDVQRYSFTDDGFDICIICQLEESVPLEALRHKFGPQSLEVWAVGSTAAYRLHLPRLYGRVLPARCALKVKPAARKLYVLLRKEADAEWPFLRG